MQVNNRILLRITLGFNERLELIQQFLVFENLGLLLQTPTATYILFPTLCMGKEPRALRDKILQVQGNHGGTCIIACVIPGCPICIYYLDFLFHFTILTLFPYSFLSSLTEI